MKILMLNYEFPPLGGGAANANAYMLEQFFRQKGDSLHIDLVTSSINTYKVEQFTPSANIHYLNIGKTGNLHYQTNKDLLTYSRNAFLYSKKLLQQQQYDLIHAFFGIPCGYLAMKLKLPYIVSLRGSDVPFYNDRFKLLDTLFFRHLSTKIWRNAAAVVANSQGLATLAQKTSPSQKIDIIYNGVDTNLYKPLLDKKPNNKLVIVSVGRLIKRKGYEYLFYALKGLTNVKLVLVGDGNYTNVLKQLSQILQLDVEFVGRKEKQDVIIYLQNADLFVLPSLNEGMSNALLEAIACGLPVIVTNVGGSAELVNQNGFIVPTHSINDLTKAITTYINYPELLTIHSQKSCEMVKNMSWQKVSEQYFNLYQQICT